MGWSLLALLAALMLLRGRRGSQALPNKQRGFVFAPALFSDQRSNWDKAIIAAAPVVWWQQRETSGTSATDSSSNSRHGTVNGSPNRAVASGFSGVGNGFQNTSSSGQYVNRASEPALNITGNVTVVIVVKPTGTQPNFPKLAWKPTNKVFGRASYLIQQENFSLGGKVLFRVTSGGNNNDAISTTALANGTSYVLVGRRSGSELSIWVNGTKEGTGVLSTAADTATLDLEVGGSTSSDCFVGVYSSFALFNRALSDAEIIAIHAARNS